MNTEEFKKIDKDILKVSSGNSQLDFDSNEAWLIFNLIFISFSHFKYAIL